MRFPPDGSDPLLLTAGHRGYDDALWTSAPAPDLPQEFVWELKTPVTPSRIQINQHPYWPACDVELLGEDSTGDRHILWSGTMPEGRPDRKGHSYVLAYLTAAAPACRVILRILSGYHAQHCGLDSVEVFGDGAVFTPDGSACSVLEEVGGLTPGATAYYRAVLEDGGEQIGGDVASRAVPQTLAPVIESVAVLERVGNPPCYAVRANAMGLETEVWGELRLADGGILEGVKASLGSQPTGRHIYYSPAGLPELEGAQFHLRARNVAGEATARAPFPCRPAT